MSEPDDIEMLAAEYALGTLDLRERERAEARRAIDPAFDAAVCEWESRLAPLVDATPDAPPPPALFARVQSAIRDSAAPERPSAPARPVLDELALRRRLRMWRAGALAAGALAASLAVGLGLSEFSRPPRDYVAVLQKGSASPGFLLRYDPHNRRLTVDPINVRLPADKSFELWLIAPASKPNSLGLLDPNRPTVRLIPAAAQTAERATYAVTLEPKGGSPTGVATGPVLFSGKFAPAQS